MEIYSFFDFYCFFKIGNSNIYFVGFVDVIWIWLINLIFSLVKIGEVMSVKFLSGIGVF